MRILQIREGLEEVADRCRCLSLRSTRRTFRLAYFHRYQHVQSLEAIRWVVGKLVRWGLTPSKLKKILMEVFIKQVSVKKSLNIRNCALEIYSSSFVSSVMIFSGYSFVSAIWLVQKKYECKGSVTWKLFGSISRRKRGGEEMMAR